MNLLKGPPKKRRMPRQKPHRSEQDLTTPRKFVKAVRVLLEITSFDIDLAASQDNAVTLAFYGIEHNALVQPWQVGDGWNWLNPPFGHILPWAKRAFEQSQPSLFGTGAQTALLVPASVGTVWWLKYVHRKARVLMLKGRLKFGGHVQGYPKDCCLLLYGPSVTPGYEVWDWRREITPKQRLTLLTRVA